MIQPSQRRSTPPRPDELLEVHERIARQRRRTRRLWGASALACGVSVVLWLLGVSVLWHLTAVGVALVVGLFLPLGSTVHWALDWVSRHLGLSYATALDLSDSPPDSYGFHEAVRKRAAAGAAKLELPQQQPWWLPFLVIALVLAILPVVPFRSAPRPTLGSTPTAPEQAPDTSEATAPQLTETEAEAEEPETPGNEGASTPEDADPEASSVDDFSTEASEGAEGNGGQGDEEALSRFTDNLSERPPPEEETNPFSSVTPQSGAPSEGEAGEQGESQPAQVGEPPQNATRQEGSPQDAQGGEAAEDGSEGSEAGEEGEGEEGEAAGTQAGEEPGEEQGEDAAAPSGEQGEEEGTQQASGEASDAEQGEGQEGEAGSDSQANTPSDQGAPEDGETGNSAGNAPGAPTPTDPERLDAPGTPEQLRGRLGEGPSSTAGSTRLQGTPEGDAAAPGGAAPQTFNQADEQAITEGRIPVEYQDIIRDYFR